MLKKITMLSLFGFSLASQAQDNPLFIEKLQNPDEYSKDALFEMPESICRRNDLQDIEEYDNRFSNIGFNYNYIQDLGTSVGALKTSSSASATSYCSGTLISSNLFLTASHCVDNRTVGEYVSFGYQVDANTGSLRNSQRIYRISSIVEDGANFNLDYAILRLEGNPGSDNGNFPGAFGTAIGWKSVAANGVPDEVAIIQHPGGNPKHIDAGDSITVSGNFIRYSDVDTQGGSSGSGVLDRFGNVVGVHTNGGCRTSGGGSNRGVYMQAIQNASSIL